MASAGDLFETLVHALDDEFVDGERKMRVLIPMIIKLEGMGWADKTRTQELFAEDPWTTEAFRRVGQREVLDGTDTAPVRSAERDTRIAATRRGRPSGRAGA